MSGLVLLRSPFLGRGPAGCSAGGLLHLLPPTPTPRRPLLHSGLGLPGTGPPSTAPLVRRPPAQLFSLQLPADSASVVSENWLCAWSPSSLQCPFSLERPARALLVALFLQQWFSAGKSPDTQLLAEAQNHRSPQSLR